MKNIDFKKHRLFLVETIVFVVIIAAFILGGIYSVLFPTLDDVRKRDYDRDYLAEIYSYDKYDFDVIEFENGEVSFSYIAQDIDLIYCKNKSPYIDSEEYLCKSIAKDWYVVEY